MRRRVGYRAYPGRLLPFYFQRIKRNIYCFSAYFNLIAIGLNSKNFPVVKNWLIRPCVWVNMSTSVLCVCVCVCLCVCMCVFMYLCVIACARTHGACKRTKKDWSPAEGPMPNAIFKKNSTLHWQ